MSWALAFLLIVCGATTSRYADIEPPPRGGGQEPLRQARARLKKSAASLRFPDFGF
jgi:hypothetical protein